MKTTSITTYARTAGLLYLLQIPLGVFGILYVPNNLIVNDNISLSIANISSNEFMFRLSIFSSILCALITIGTAIFIYKVLEPVKRQYAKWIVIFTLIVAPITLINELNNVAILHLCQKVQSLRNTSNVELIRLVSLFLDLHQYGIKIIDIFFGLWLLPMGYLVIKSKYIPKVIGYLLLFTCIGYLTDFTTFFLFPDFKLVVSEYAWIGEVVMVFWLIIFGFMSNHSKILHKLKVAGFFDKLQI